MDHQHTCPLQRLDMLHGSCAAWHAQTTCTVMQSHRGLSYSGLCLVHKQNTSANAPEEVS